MSQRVASRFVSFKGAEALLLTPPLIGLHSKAPNQAFITERPVLAFLQPGRNVISWLFLRYDYIPFGFLFQVTLDCDNEVITNFERLRILGIRQREI